MDMRDDLEAQVLNLARQRDVLASEAGSMQALQQAVQDLGAEADALRQALRTESEKQVGGVLHVLDAGACLPSPMVGRTSVW